MAVVEIDERGSDMCPSYTMLVMVVCSLIFDSMGVVMGIIEVLPLA